MVNGIALKRKKVMLFKHLRSGSKSQGKIKIEVKSQISKYQIEN